MKGKKLKIRICTFEIAKYGGMITNIEGRIRAFQEMGHDIDIIILSYQKTISHASYTRKLKDLESGKFQDTKELKSQNGGYSKSEITGYWRNSYYGWHLPPVTNKIPVFHEDGLKMWHDAVDDCDIVFWAFMPTKTSFAKGFSTWPQFFDLPKNVTQIMGIHDGYFDVRSSWVRYLSSKIKYLDCAHVSAYNSVKNIAIPRYLNFISRYVPNKLPLTGFDKRPIDFFSAHVFKTMKRVEDILIATPYLDGDYSTVIAGSGIELYYMILDDETKLKECYKINKKNDPDCDDKEVGKSIWKRAEKNGMEYVGFLSNEDVHEYMRNSKFAIDASFSKHYAQYSNTHLNGFTIEAINSGCYPVLRDTRGMIKNTGEIDDIIHRELRAIYIPWDATPKQFAEKLNEAMQMSESDYKKDILHNFKLAKKLFDPKKNMSDVITLTGLDNVEDYLEKGENSERVLKDSEKVMREFFKVELPIKWQY